MKSAVAPLAAVTLSGNPCTVVPSSAATPGGMVPLTTKHVVRSGLFRCMVTHASASFVMSLVLAAGDNVTICTPSGVLPVYLRLCSALVSVRSANRMIAPATTIATKSVTMTLMTRSIVSPSVGSRQYAAAILFSDENLENPVYKVFLRAVLLLDDYLVLCRVAYCLVDAAVHD